MDDLEDPNKVWMDGISKEIEVHPGDVGVIWCNFLGGSLF